MGGEPSCNLNGKGYSASYRKDFNNKRTNITGSINGPYDSFKSINCGLRLDHQAKNTSSFGEVNKSFDGRPLNYNAGIGHTFNEGRSTISGTVSGYKGFSKYNDYGLRYDYNHKDTSAFVGVSKNFGTGSMAVGGGFKKYF